MDFDPEIDCVFLDIKPIKNGGYMNDPIYIPMSKIFQVQRGLTSAIQRFNVKKNTTKR